MTIVPRGSLVHLPLAPAQNPPRCPHIGFWRERMVVLSIEILIPAEATGWPGTLDDRG